MRTVEGHHDFAVLERRLAALIQEIKDGDPDGLFAPVAVVAPTRHLLSHLQCFLAASRPALLNVRFYHHASLAHAAAGALAARTLTPQALEMILADLIETAGGDLALYVRARPGSVAALAATMNDLREAGVPAETGARLPGLSESGRDMCRLYARYVETLDRLAPRGLTDRSGILKAAVRRAAEVFGTLRLLVHFGAYELIGSNLELLKAIEACGVRLAYLVPYHLEAPAYARSRDFWRQALDSPVTVISPGGGSDRLLADRVPLLYDESALMSAAGDERVSFFHAQGATAELREVALRILVLHRDHQIPLDRVAIVARSLEPYAPLLRTVFPGHGLPFTTSASLGALREPRVLAALHLTRAILGDLERQPLMDLFRSGLFRHRSRDVAREAHAWDMLSRRARVTRGEVNWTRHLPAWVDQSESGDPGNPARKSLTAIRQARRRQARALAAVVRGLVRAAGPLKHAASWNEWARAAATIFRTHLDGFQPPEGQEEPDPGARVVLETLAGMQDLDAAGLRYTGGNARACFERALQNAAVPIGSVAADGGRAMEAGGGIRILDAMQARGLAFDAVFLIGFNADLFPRRPREDPFLGDTDRRVLRDRLTLPVPVKAAGREEERLLLAHLVGSARRWVTVSWQRADENGKARVPSLALRELARLTLGGADLGRVVKMARRIPTHPSEAGVDALERHRLLPGAVARESLALQLRSPHRLLDALPGLPPSPAATDTDTLRAGLVMLRVIENDSPTDPAYDALVGDACPLPDVWSPSRLELLGACPQHYFFRHVLHVDEMREPLDDHDLDAAELGQGVHRILHDAYAGLADAGGPDGSPGDPSHAVRRAEELVGRAWAAHMEPLGERMRARYPLLWETTSALWLGAVLDFVREDVAELVSGGGQLAGLEREATASLPLGASGRRLAIRGRFDRIVRDGQGVVIVSDYKTGGRLAQHVRSADLLKGTRLQMPLYHLMAESLLAEWGFEGSAVRVEVLGVGPPFSADAASGHPEERRAVLDPQTFKTIRPGFVETVASLVDLAAGGAFPLAPESRLCSYCPYVRACRRLHTPTLERLASSPWAAAHALLGGKSTLARTLADVRTAAARKDRP